MKLPKDILMIDFEGTEEPAQIGAVLLDKDTLEEKDSFKSYIWADLKGQTAEGSGINQEMLKGAPSRAEVGKAIFERFGTNVFLASWVANYDMESFKKIISAAGIGFEHYDYHVLDLWPATYFHLLKKGYAGSPRSEEMFREFGAKPRGLHDPVEDCRLAADILRKIAA